MLYIAFSTGSEFWDLILRRPFMFFIGYVLINVIVLGIGGFLGGFWPKKVKLSVGTFITSRRNAYNSERLTRIVQWRYCDGKKLPDALREEVLNQFGPSSSRRPKHYKKVKKNDVQPSKNNNL